MFRFRDMPNVKSLLLLVPDAWCQLPMHQRFLSNIFGCTDFFSAICSKWFAIASFIAERKEIDVLIFSFHFIFILLLCLFIFINWFGSPSSSFSIARLLVLSILPFISTSLYTSYKYRQRKITTTKNGFLFETKKSDWNEMPHLRCREQKRRKK